MIRIRLQRRKPRGGMSSLELVMSTAVMLPLAVLIFFAGAEAAQLFYQMVTTLVGWPHL
jgi:hypothetical protein